MQMNYEDQDYWYIYSLLLLTIFQLYHCCQLYW